MEKTIFFEITLFFESFHSLLSAQRGLFVAGISVKPPMTLNVSLLFNRGYAPGAHPQTAVFYGQHAP